MKKRFSKSTILKTTHKVGDKELPVKIYKEMRTNVRASIGKKAAILRMPMLLTKSEEAKHLKWFHNWLETQVDKHEHLQERFFGKDYKDGDTLIVGKRQYILKFTYTQNKSHNAKIDGNIITLKLSQLDSSSHLQQSIKELLSRVVGGDFLAEISVRVRELNHLYFKKDIQNIRLKYNKSNWGSCSTNKNINLSTRLLFAPDDVIDYVIIHELSHLVEMNHSARFWKVVSDIMPDYQEKERWLKKNGQSCDF